MTVSTRPNLATTILAANGIHAASASTQGKIGPWPFHCTAPSPRVGLGVVLLHEIEIPEPVKTTDHEDAARANCGGMKCSFDLHWWLCEPPGPFTTVECIEDLEAVQCPPVCASANDVDHTIQGNAAAIGTTCKHRVQTSPLASVLELLTGLEAFKKFEGCLAAVATGKEDRAVHDGRPQAAPPLPELNTRCVEGQGHCLRAEID
mmetsp:Transcript_83220/g.209759  ORF Transcript_83220/g.209759 Transcript_83220/m.209759 type:complete len:205 (+) Transcript_83220:361-975(+)